MPSPNPRLAPTPQAWWCLSLALPGVSGKAASKSVELAFNEINKAAGAQGIAGLKLAFDLRDAQSQGLVAVD